MGRYWVKIFSGGRPARGLAVIPDAKKRCQAAQFFRAKKGPSTALLGRLAVLGLWLSETSAGSWLGVFFVLQARVRLESLIGPLKASGGLHEGLGRSERPVHFGKISGSGCPQRL